MSSPIQVLIDISGFGDFSGPLDDVTSRVLLSSGLNTTRGKNQIKQFSQAEAGRSDFTLDNTSGDYDALEPGMKVCIKLAATAGGGFDFEDSTDFDFEDGTPFEFEGAAGLIISTGRIDDLKQDVNPFLPTVQVFCLGMLSQIVNRTVSTELIENETIDELIDRVLTAAGWPTVERSISVSAKTLGYLCLDNADPFSAIAQLVLTEGGHWYEGRNGYFTFEDAHYRTTAPRSTVSQADYLDAILRDRDPSANYKELVDACTVNIEERELQPLDELWSLGADLILTAGQVKRFTIKGSDFFKNLTLPSLVGTNAVQRIISDKPLTSGTVALLYKGTATADIDWDADAGTVQAKLEDVVGGGNVSVVGTSFTSGFFIYFEGALKWQSIELLTVQSSLNPTSVMAMIDVVMDDPLGPTQTLIANPKPLNVGSFRGQYGSHITDPIPYDAPATGVGSIQTIFRALGPGVFPGTSLTVSGSGTIATDNMSVNIDEGSAPEGLLPISIVDASTLMASGVAGATLLVTTSIVGTGPDLVVTSGDVSFTFNQTSGAQAIMTATAGTSGVTGTGLRVRGSLFSVVRRHQVSYPEDATDPTWVDDFLAANGRPPRIERPDIHPGLSRSDALMFCEDFVNAYDTRRQTDEIEILKAISASDLDTLFEREPSDRVTATPGPAFTERLSYSTDGVLVRAVFGLEQVAA